MQILWHYDLQVIEEIEEMMQDSPEQNPTEKNLIHRSNEFEESKYQKTGLIVFF